MAILKAIIVSLALGLVGSNVLGAAVKEEVKDQATTSSATDGVYNVSCNGSYCSWRCNDNSDWCWIASVNDGFTTNPDPHWIKCKTPADCTKEMNGLRKHGRKAMCKSTWSGYSSLGQLKCVAKEMEEMFRKADKEHKEQEEAVRKAWEARQARLNMVSAKLPPGGLDAVKEQVIQDVFPELRNPPEPPVNDFPFSKKPKKPVRHGDSRPHMPGIPVADDDYEDGDLIKKARAAVEKAALALSDDDLKLPPETLKSKLVERAKMGLQKYNFD